MTEEKQRLVRESWALAATQRDLLAETFYARLFQIAPQLRSLFAKTDMHAQGRKFVDMMTHIVASLGNQPSLVLDVATLGRSHAGYGVKDRDYPVVGEALLFALEQRLGEAFTLEVRAAWREAYLLLAALMQRGAHTGATPPVTKT